MRYIEVGVLFLVISIIFTPTASAWNWYTHSQIAEAVYYGLPTDVQQKLDLNIMKDASNDPDEIFKDFKHHSYPDSYQRAESWLEKGKKAYDQGDYENASYCYGVASHYISDTFSAPHCVSKESSLNHSKYEDQAGKLTPVATYSSEDLKSRMEDGYNQEKINWDEWLRTHDSAIVQDNLNMGASAALSAIKDSINGESENSQQTDLFRILSDLLKGTV